jgi:hypothetical protein
MRVARLFPRFRHSRWLLLSFILGSFFAASCSEAGQRPAAADLTKVKITLQRSACEGGCPEYKVTIHGDGRVVFMTEPARALMQAILLPGTHEDQIAPEKVAALFAQFQKAGFFNLRSSYVSGWVDIPESVLTVDTGRRQKSVTDSWGEKVGMPKIVTELQEAVDKVAGTDRWLRGTAGLVTWLEEQNFDFHSPEAVQLAVLGARTTADEAVVLALIDDGVPLDSVISIRKQGPSVVAGFDLMESAIRRGHAGLFSKLASAGWLDGMGREQAAQLLAKYAAGCSPALIDLAADAGIDIDKPEPPRPDAPRYEPQGKTALANLSSARCGDYRETDGNRQANRIATARGLLARGANPNHRDSLGRNPLFYAVGNPDMLNLLLVHGADRDSAGPGFQKCGPR